MRIKSFYELFLAKNLTPRNNPVYEPHVSAPQPLDERPASTRLWDSFPPVAEIGNEPAGSRFYTRSLAHKDAFSRHKQ